MTNFNHRQPKLALEDLLLKARCIVMSPDPKVSTLIDDDLRALVRASLEKLLNRRATTADRFAMIRDLRIELGRAFSHATAQGVVGIAFRARLIAICNAELAELEETITAGAQHLPGVRRGQH
ncbi:hypothetical protein [Muricoccus radiodurans]|uniref:hypothetical protein n=1 Tax=Muricoccus radiodurans TaxID=2231721 RepID=UPI003CF1ABFC